MQNLLGTVRKQVVAKIRGDFQSGARRGLPCQLFQGGRQPHIHQAQRYQTVRKRPRTSHCATHLAAELVDHGRQVRDDGLNFSPKPGEHAGQPGENLAHIVMQLLADELALPLTHPDTLFLQFLPLIDDLDDSRDVPSPATGRGTYLLRPGMPNPH